MMADVSSCVAHHGWVVCNSFTCMIDWLDHWQTLIAGSGAVVAASVSVWFLRKQTVAAASQEKVRRERRLAAARSRLQFTVADASEYASEALELLKAYVDGGPRQLSALARRPRPLIPEVALRSFEDVIEATDDPAFAGLLADLISEMQVLDSNLRHVGRDRSAYFRPNLVSFVARAAKVHGYTDTIFPYARREVAVPPSRLDWSRVAAALSLANMYVEHYAEFHEFIDRARSRAEANG